jgi:hypothetical protein
MAWLFQTVPSALISNLRPQSFMATDNQLGIHLRLRRSSGLLTRQVMESLVRDLVGADQSLMAPLLHLVGSPSFLAVDPTRSTVAIRLLRRDQLLRDLEATYTPTVLARLGDVLNGYLDLGDLDNSPGTAPPLEPLEASAPSSIPVPQPTAITSPAPTWTPPQSHPSVPTPSVSRVLSSPPSAPSSWTPGSVPAGSPPTSLLPLSAPVTSSTQPRKRLPIALGATLVFGSVVVLASQSPLVCRSLGTCSTEKASGPSTSSASKRALATASNARKAMEAAQDLPSYRAALADLDRELLYLSGDRLSTAQKNQLEGLQASARQGHQRVSVEEMHAENVASASRRIDTLPSLPNDQQANKQSSLGGVLEGIPASSFSYARAQGQLQRLAASATAPAPVPPTAPAPPAARAPHSGGSQEQGSMSAREQAPLPAPVPVPSPPRRGEPSSGSSTESTQGTWAPSPARSAPPTPAQQENGTGNAPYRDDPLF